MGTDGYALIQGRGEILAASDAIAKSPLSVQPIETFASTGEREAYLLDQEVDA